jgi:hypothetical protein
MILAFLDEPCDTDASKTRFRRLMEVGYLRALKGADIPWKMFVEQHEGKARTPRDIVSVPPNVDTNRATLDVALDIYRERLLRGELGEDELLSVVQLLVGAEKAEAEMIARILGDQKGGARLLKDRAEALLAKLEARLGSDVPTTPALPPVESPQPDPNALTDSEMEP